MTLTYKSILFESTVKPKTMVTVQPEDLLSLCLAEAMWAIMKRRVLLQKVNCKTYIASTGSVLLMVQVNIPVLASNVLP